MSNNPILDEIHRVRAELSDQFGGDLEALGRHLRERQKAHGDPVATLPPKRPRTQCYGINVEGIYRDGSVELCEPVDWPDGCRVRVILEDGNR